MNMENTEQNRMIHCVSDRIKKDDSSEISSLFILKGVYIRFQNYFDTIILLFIK